MIFILLQLMIRVSKIRSRKIISNVRRDQLGMLLLIGIVYLSHYSGFISKYNTISNDLIEDPSRSADATVPTQENLPNDPSYLSFYTSRYQSFVDRFFDRIGANQCLIVVLIGGLILLVILAAIAFVFTVVFLTVCRLTVQIIELACAAVAWIIVHIIYFITRIPCQIMLIASLIAFGVWTSSRTQSRTRTEPIEGGPPNDPLLEHAQETYVPRAYPTRFIFRGPNVSIEAIEARPLGSSYRPPVRTIENE